MKNKAGYWVFKKLVQLAYLFLGLRALKEAVSSKPKAVSELPDKIENFEDLYWLFFSNFLNRGIGQMDFNEAAYLFGTVRKNKPRGLLEIGTCNGGTTMLLATAKLKEAKLISLDIKNHCHKTVKKLLDKNTFLTIADSKKFIPSFKLDFLLIDGDHSFEGVKSDFEHYWPYLNNGADVLFHDAVGSKKYVLVVPTVNSFVKTLESNPNLKFIKDIGSIRHIKKIG